MTKTSLALTVRYRYGRLIDDNRLRLGLVT
jgi:hypothetical protein